VDDMAAAVVFCIRTTRLPERYLYNVGTGEDLTIKHLARNDIQNKTQTSRRYLYKTTAFRLGNG
jgi:hypothetical protein